MRVRSFIRQSGELKPVEIEISLLPGLPQISFLGLPDAALKESIPRIRSAIRAQGFSLPQTSQAIVQLWPTHLRKSSRGLDLAVAVALLWETGQLPRCEEGELPVLYGELSLKGEVLAPDDIDELPIPAAEGVITGQYNESLPFLSRQASTLRTVLAAPFVPASALTSHLIRPTPEVFRFSQSTASLASVIATGEHATLLAGPPGSGKSTLANVIPSLLTPPIEAEYREVLRLWKSLGRVLHWRPVVQPHHSITALAMVGGGTALWSGEIARAHGGVLILDELLEFDRQVHEALREPVESGTLSIARAGRVRESPARILLLATTNLCLCGKFVPKPHQGRCTCTRAKRSRVLGRLSGPFLDRFALLSFTDEWLGEPNRIEWSDIKQRVDDAVRFRIEVRQQTCANAHLPAEKIERSLCGMVLRQLRALTGISQRRRASVLRISRTLADLSAREEISSSNFDEAIGLALESHRAFDEWRD